MQILALLFASSMALSKSLTSLSLDFSMFKIPLCAVVRKELVQVNDRARAWHAVGAQKWWVFLLPAETCPSFKALSVVKCYSKPFLNLQRPYFLLRSTFRLQFLSTHFSESPW